MIRYTLTCENEDAFEGWFGSSADYDSQEAGGMIECPLCGSRVIRKAPMAPAVARRDRGEATPDPAALRRAFVEHVRSHVRDNFDYVGDRFASEVRAIHDGVKEADRPIWGEATAEDAKALIEEGLPVAPLPAPLAPTPPRKLN